MTTKPFDETIWDGLTGKQALAIERALNESFGNLVVRQPSRLLGMTDDYQRIVAVNPLTDKQRKTLCLVTEWFLYGVGWQKQNPQPDPGALYAADPPQGGTP